jgi:hypothetical protein
MMKHWTSCDIKLVKAKHAQNIHNIPSFDMESLIRNFMVTTSWSVIQGDSNILNK